MLRSTLLRIALVIRTLSAKQMFHQCLRSSFSRLQGAIGPHLKPVAGDGEKGLSWEHRVTLGTTSALRAKENLAVV